MNKQYKAVVIIYKMSKLVYKSECGSNIGVNKIILTADNPTAMNPRTLNIFDLIIS